MIYEREVDEDVVEEDVFGIGVDVNKGEMFWFHREVEAD